MKKENSFPDIIYWHTFS